MVRLHVEADGERLLRLFYVTAHLVDHPAIEPRHGVARIDGDRLIELGKGLLRLPFPAQFLTVGHQRIHIDGTIFSGVHLGIRFSLGRLSLTRGVRRQTSLDAARRLRSLLDDVTTGPLDHSEDRDHMFSDGLGHLLDDWFNTLHHLPDTFADRL